MNYIAVFDPLLKKRPSRRIDILNISNAFVYNTFYKNKISITKKKQFKSKLKPVVEIENFFGSVLKNNMFFKSIIFIYVLYCFYVYVLYNLQAVRSSLQFKYICINILYKAFSLSVTYLIIYSYHRHIISQICLDSLKI